MKEECICILPLQALFKAFYDLPMIQKLKEKNPSKSLIQHIYPLSIYVKLFF